MAEPPERPNPDRYDVLRAFEKGNSEKPPQENTKPEATQQQSTSNRSAVAGWPQSQDRVTQERAAFGAIKRAGEMRETPAAPPPAPPNNTRIEEFTKQSKELEKALAETTMNDKTTSGKETAANDQSSAKTAREKLALSIAAEKQNAGEKPHDHSKSRGREREE